MMSREEKLKKKREYMKKKRDENPEKYKEIARKSEAKHRDKRLLRHKNFMQSNRGKEVRRNQRRKLKIEIISEYGGKCACCGESHIEFLTIDHEFGDGGRFRKETGLYGGTFYQWLKKHNYSKDLGLRVLCANCNSSYGSYGYCPHHN